MSKEKTNFYETLLYELHIEAIDNGGGPLFRQALFECTAETFLGLTNSAAVDSLLDSFRALVLKHREGVSQLQGSTCSTFVKRTLQ